MEITSTKTAATNGVKCLIYGQSGCGKTYISSTLTGKTLILSAEAGLLSLRKFDIDSTVIKDMEGLKAAYKFIKDDTKYSNIVLDSLSEIAENILEVEAAKKTKSGEPVGLAAYNELFKHVKSLCKAFRDLSGKNVIFTAKVERQKDDISGMMLLSPAMPGKALTGTVPYLFDEVFYLTAYQNKETGTMERSLQTQGTNQVMAKDRSGCLDIYEPADLTLIFNKINATGEKKEKQP